jgi:RNA polymerase sigma-70 factor (ECF subfamily)
LEAADAVVVARIRVGDASAFETLFRDYYKDLRRYATGLTRDVDIAEELVADVFVAVWERHAEWRVHHSIRAHLFASVRHRVLHWHRRLRLEARHIVGGEDLLDMAVTVSVPTDQAVEWEEVVRIVRTAINRLPPRTREAYVLHRQDELTYAEIAGIMGTTVKTVEKQIGAALRALRIALRAVCE